jgi:ferric-dicitrate binding protein FerR (iron transport regulator)
MTKGRVDPERMNNYFRNTNSRSDETYIRNVFTDNDSEIELRHILSRQFYNLFSEDKAEEKNLDHILYRINYEINTNLAKKGDLKTNRLISYSLKIAGILILALSVFWGIKGYNNHSIAKQTWIEIKAPAWTRARFSLPDGTTGWLNSNSGIRYNGTFLRDRKLTLTGEAFFDVARDEKRPFRVSADDVVVNVLGTRFNIASYENEENVEIVLEEGKLEFTALEKNNSGIMNPNDLILYNKKSTKVTSRIVEPEKYISWTDGRLVFRNDPIDVIARRLERWYNVEVEIRGNLSNDLRLRATFVDESLEQVLYYLNRSLPIEYKIINSHLKTDDTYAKRKVVIYIK